MCSDIDIATVETRFRHLCSLETKKMALEEYPRRPKTTIITTTYSDVNPRLPPATVGCLGVGVVQPVCRAETRRYGAEHAIGSSDLVNDRGCRAQSKGHYGQDLSRH